MSLEDIGKTAYIQNFEDISNKVLPVIKEAFIEYYGVGNKAKIESIFNNLTITFFSQNEPRKLLKESIKNLKETLIEILPVYRLSAKKDQKILTKIYNGKINVDLKSVLINLGLCVAQLEHKQNDNDKKIILYRVNHWGYEKNQIDIVREKDDFDGLAFSNSENPSIFVSINDGFINLHTLIHEISHALAYNKIMKNESGKTIVIQGIHDNNDNSILNEVINEYITNDVIEIVLSKIKAEKYNLKTERKSTYLITDEIFYKLGLRIYSLFKPVIQHNLINGNNLVIKNIMNSNPQQLFNDINKKYYMAFQIIRTYRPIASDSLKNVLIEVRKKIGESNLELNNDEYIEILKQSLEEYYRYEESVKTYVDELVESGKARRVGSNK